MKIYLEHISKRFQKHWIFKDINTSFSSPEAYAILGANGSGKSTLLRVLSGMQTASVGKIKFEYNGAELEQDQLFNHVAFCAPAMEIVEEFTLKEFLEFHFNFKKIQDGLTIYSIIEKMGLTASINKPISDFSSGMKQRVKLAQAIFADTPFLLLDEPCSNLDETGVQQYRDWIEEYAKNRLVIVASNDVREYYFCTHTLNIEDYK